MDTKGAVIWETRSLSLRLLADTPRSPQKKGEAWKRVYRISGSFAIGIKQIAFLKVDSE